MQVPSLAKLAEPNPAQMVVPGIASWSEWGRGGVGLPRMLPVSPSPANRSPPSWREPTVHGAREVRLCHLRAATTQPPLQLPLPLTELMENEALEILTEALRSEPPHPLLPARHPPPLPPTSTRDPGGFCRPWSYRNGVSGCICLVRFPYHPQIFQKL